MVKNFQDGTICHIAFYDTLGNEMKDYHLGILFNIPGVAGMGLCIPLTSPKNKHFISTEGFEKRDHMKLKFSRWHYIIQTDSIAQLEQIRMVSTDRILSYYKCGETNQIQVLNEEEMNLIKERVTKFIKTILYKK